MKKVGTVFFMLMMIAVGFVMYAYWQQETDVMMKGVLV